MITEEAVCAAGRCIMSKDIRPLLKEIVDSESGFVELRYAGKTSRGIVVEKGKVEGASVKRRMKDAPSVAIPSFVTERSAAIS